MRTKAKLLFCFSGNRFHSSWGGASYMGGVCSLTKGGGVNEVSPASHENDYIVYSHGKDMHTGLHTDCNALMWGCLRLCEGKNTLLCFISTLLPPSFFSMGKQTRCLSPSPSLWDRTLESSRTRRGFWTVVKYWFICLAPPTYTLLYSQHCSWKYLICVCVCPCACACVCLCVCVGVWKQSAEMVVLGDMIASCICCRLFQCTFISDLLPSPCFCFGSRDTETLKPSSLDTKFPRNIVLLCFIDLCEQLNLFTVAAC